MVGVWKAILIIKHGEPPDSRKKVLEKKETNRKGRRRKRKINLCMSKNRLSHEGNPISRGIYAANVSPPSPEEKHKSSLEINPNNISLRKLFVDENMMEDFLGADYKMDEIIEEIGAQPCSEEVPTM